MTLEQLYTAAELDKQKMLSYSIKALESAARSTSAEGNSKIDVDIKSAFISLLKSTTLILQIIPKHKTPCPNLKELQLLASIDLDTLEDLKKKIIEQSASQDLKERIKALKLSHSVVQTPLPKDIYKNPVLHFPFTRQVMISDLIPYIESKTVNNLASILYLDMSIVHKQYNFMQFYISIKPMTYTSILQLKSINPSMLWSELINFDIICLYNQDSSLDDSIELESLYDAIFDSNPTNLCVIKHGQLHMNTITVSPPLITAPIPSTPNIASIFDDPYFNFSSTLRQTQQPSTIKLYKPVQVKVKPIELPSLPPKPQQQAVVQQEFRFHNSQVSHVEYGIGLKNLGNTCYMNASLQALKATAPLFRYFTSGKYKQDINTANLLGHKGQLVTALFSVFKLLSNPDYFSSYCAPSDFKEKISFLNPMFEGSEQHDASEFIGFLLDGCHEDLKQSRTSIQNPKTEQEWEQSSLLEYSTFSYTDYITKNQSIISELLMGQFASKLTCLTCKMTSTSFSMFSQLSVPVVDPNECLLEDCIQDYSQIETLTGNNQWKCSRCKTTRDASKTLELTRLPNILIVHLKRFAFDGNFKRKLGGKVIFPSYNLKIKDAFGTTTKYDLYGIVYQFGGLDSGHYTSACKYMDKWLYFDDTRISHSNDKEFDYKAAYILFYVKSQ